MMKTDTHSYNAAIALTHAYFSVSSRKPAQPDGAL